MLNNKLQKQIALIFTVTGFIVLLHNMITNLLDNIAIIDFNFFCILGVTIISLITWFFINNLFRVIQVLSLLALSIIGNILSTGQMAPALFFIMTICLWIAYTRNNYLSKFIFAISLYILIITLIIIFKHMNLKELTNICIPVIVSLIVIIYIFKVKTESYDELIDRGFNILEKINKKSHEYINLTKEYEKQLIIIEQEADNVKDTSRPIA